MTLSLAVGCGVQMRERLGSHRRAEPVEEVAIPEVVFVADVSEQAALEQSLTQRDGLAPREALVLDEPLDRLGPDEAAREHGEPVAAVANVDAVLPAHAVGD